MLGAKFKIALFIIIASQYLSAQENTPWLFKDNISVTGYVKYLPSASFTTTGQLYNNNLIHNRLNIKAYLSDALTAKLALRNRVFFGQMVKRTPNFGSLIAVDNGELDLSLLIVNKASFVVHSILDRAYIDYSNTHWQARVGRQRINWGINLAWNTNDLFNAYNIVDFDYEERAGADAVRIQYYTGNSSLDLAYKPGKDSRHTVLAAMYKFNRWAYDFQFLVANYYDDIAFGTGWAGSINSLGFKGEATLFIDKINSNSVTAISTSVDYFFKNGLYANLSMLFTSNGQSTFDTSVLNFTSNTLTAKKLMPTKYAYLAQVTNTFNPRFKGSMTAIYGQGMNIFFLMPAVDYSLKDNWDLNITAQLFYADRLATFNTINNSLFLRIQYSF